MGDPFDFPPAVAGDPLRSTSDDNNNQNMANGPNAFPPTQGAAAPAAQGFPPPTQGAASPKPSPKGPVPPPAGARSRSKSQPGSEPGDGVQELQESESSDSKKRRNKNKPKIDKLKQKMKRIKIFYWIATSIWLVFIVIFILLHINHFGIHVLPLGF